MHHSRSSSSSDSGSGVIVGEAKLDITAHGSNVELQKCAHNEVIRVFTVKDGEFDHCNENVVVVVVVSCDVTWGFVCRGFSLTDAVNTRSTIYKLKEENNT